MEQDTTHSTQTPSKWSLQAIGQYLASAMLGGALTFGSLGLMGQTQPTPLIIEPPQPTATAVPTATPAPIRVYANGAVQTAGVYTLPVNSILEDLIEAAGGFREDAHTTPVNLAQPLSDGMQIYVPTEEEYTNTNTEALPPVITGEVEPVTETSTGQTETAGSGVLVNINTASQSELESLPGVGPSTAEKIIAYREEVGLFVSIQDIMNVSGIGTGKFANMESSITVE